ncbi:hypothetical protein CCDC5079_1578 [Mycobacterium tuberculosis CCDC5079]|nr:hypothetical protein CCDC5079_1578 [Mycobacterium tuberculosis CCDC5079]
MYSSSREEAVAAFDNLDTALNRVLKVSPDDLTIPECLAMLQRCEKIRRRLPAAEHPFINKLADQTDQTELGGKLPFAWPNGYTSAAAKHPDASMKPPTWAHAAR